jgi:transmembrane sensor
MDSQTIEATAARWLVKRAGAAWGQADQDELDTWLNESTLHRVAFVRLDSVWQRMARLKALGGGVPKGVIPGADYWSLGGKSGNTDAAQELLERTPRHRWYGVAAGLALGIVAGSWLWLTQGRDGTRYSTPVGGLETLTLADGSRVTLNTDTSVRVHFDQNRRRIDLDSGEAYFVVARDPSRPLAVYVGHERISAVGTEFSVRHDSAAVQVIVTDGRVQVSSADTGSSLAARTVAAGELARADPSAVLVSHASELELDRLLSWREGFVVFQDTPLADAVAEFNRYHTQKIRVADPSIAAIRISGKFRPGNTAAFLWLLQQGFPVAVEQQGQQILLRRGA